MRTYGRKELTLQDAIYRNIETLWKKFQDIFVDCNGNLKTAWYAFPKGTNKIKYMIGYLINLNSVNTDSG